MTETTWSVTVDRATCNHDWCLCEPVPREYRLKLTGTVTLNEELGEYQVSDVTVTDWDGLDPLDLDGSAAGDALIEQYRSEVES